MHRPQPANRLADLFNLRCYLILRNGIMSIVQVSMCKCGKGVLNGNDTTVQFLYSTDCGLCEGFFFADPHSCPEDWFCAHVALEVIQVSLPFFRLWKTIHHVGLLDFSEGNFWHVAFSLRLRCGGASGWRIPAFI